MYKKSSSVFTIVFKSFSTFFYRLPQFLKCMLYPAFGQFAGILLCFAPFLIAPDARSVYAPMLIVTAPIGLVIFCHSFWRYLLISGALVLMAGKIVENEPVDEVKNYTKLFSQRSSEYIAYLLIIFLISLVLVLVLIGIVFGYLILNPGIAAAGNNTEIIKLAVIVGIIGAVISPVLFTVPLESFVLNANLTPFESIIKAAKLTLRNYFPNWGILILTGLITGVWGEVTGYFSRTFVFTPMFYQNHGFQASDGIPQLLNASFLAAFANLLLPFTTICFTWWYLRMEKERNAKIAGYRK